MLKRIPIPVGSIRALIDRPMSRTIKPLAKRLLRYGIEYATRHPPLRGAGRLVLNRVPGVKARLLRFSRPTAEPAERPFVPVTVADLPPRARRFYAVLETPGKDDLNACRR